MNKRYRETRKGIIESMLPSQGGMCMMCPRELTLRTARIDHYHGHCAERWGCEVCRRSILCNRCNTMLGRAQDSPSVLRTWGVTRTYSAELIASAIVYLDFWHAEMTRRGVREHDFVTPAIAFFSELITEVLGQSKLA
jgi:hypothetical protein